MRARLAVLALVLLCGCATGPKPVFHWGPYEDLLYTDYAAPGKMPPEQQIAELERDYQKARAQGLPVHPGFHAHLGRLYYQIGKLDQARQEFSTEKAQFPESAVFMDRLLANLERK